MAWFGVSVILGIRMKHGMKDCVPAWENVYLVEADTPEMARRAAEDIGKEHGGKTHESLSWDGQPAEWIFAGVRKVTPIRSNQIDDNPENGAEIAYSEFEVASFEDLDRLAKGEAVTVKYVE